MEKAQYIVKKRMRVEGIGGRVNLPTGHGWRPWTA